ncbi:hypothetical protein B296_00008416 [Ensete ventricosum]|uniref:Uncharacterized protein n=1 Tax=Ensete ventricosum TaxID=4639 RepID=A0A427AVX5_ENSVE|nr:hypothetical protein B296_00008416 [Ensete ventricosum]
MGRDEYPNPGLVEISLVVAGDDLLHEVAGGTEPAPLPQQERGLGGVDGGPGVQDRLQIANQRRRFEVRRSRESAGGRRRQYSIGDKIPVFGIRWRCLAPRFVTFKNPTVMRLSAYVKRQVARTL